MHARSGALAWPALVAAVALLALTVAACGDDGGEAFVGSWKADDGSSMGLRVTSGDGDYLVAVHDLSLAADDSVLFITAALMQDGGGALKLQHEPEGDAVVEGGTLVLEGETLVYTDHAGAVVRLTRVDVLTPER